MWPTLNAQMPNILDSWPDPTELMLNDLIFEPFNIAQLAKDIETWGYDMRWGVVSFDSQVLQNHYRTWSEIFDTIIFVVLSFISIFKIK